MASNGPAAVPVDSAKILDRVNENLSSTRLTADQSKDGMTQESAAESEAQREGGTGLCQFFLLGKCRFGHKCRLSHSAAQHVPPCDPVSNDPETRPTGPGMDGEKDCKHKRRGKSTKNQKPENTEGKGPSKKPRMRTAEEVISRILWDPMLEEGDFVVGYVDRFLGVLERPFSEFNWDADPCDCDYTTELALPQHRIQYFTHRGRRVWDRNTRTDKVFGSTGHPLAPPFGGEEEEEGEKKADITLQEEGEKEETGHLGEKEQSETNVDAPESAKVCLADDPGAGSTSQCQQEAGRGFKPFEEEDINEAADSHLDDLTEQISLSEREGATGVEEADTSENWKDSWDRDVSLSHVPCIYSGPGESQCVPLKQREEKQGGRPPKRKPTHFITFRANTPAILSSFQRLQEELTTLLPSSAPSWVTPSSLHVTLCLLVLSGPDELTAATEILRRFAQLDRNPPVALSFPLKLKHFNGRVLYLSPQPKLHLEQLNNGLQKAYMEQGWLHRDSYAPRYHLTLAKVWDSRGERPFEGVGAMRVGKGLNFGRLPVNRLHLCAMGMSDDGFYDIVCTVTLR